MEENPETQMETDVMSSTDGSEVQDTMSTVSDMETVIVVEEIKEEDWPPESKNNAQSINEVMSTEKEATSSTSDSEETPTIVSVTPQKTPQVSSKTKSPIELQLSPPKETMVVRTYSRSPISLLKDTQLSISKLDQSPNKQSIQEVTDSSCKLLVKQDSEIKHQHKILQKSPTKIEQPKDTQPTTNTVESPSKHIAKKDLKSPSKDKALQKSPTKVEQSTSIQPDVDTQELINKIPPKIDNPNRNILDNPLLLNALSKQTELKIISETIKPVNPEERPSIVISEPSVDILSEKSSDSTLDSNLETTETHNKSISRELKSLIKSAKESKIISECTQLTTKTRKSRGDISSLNTSNLDPERPIASRRSSDNTQTMNSHEKSEKSNLKRSMRSQNPEFVNKVKLFLNSVTGKASKSESELISEEETEEKKTKDIDPSDLLSRSPKKKKTNETELTTPVKSNKIRCDPYCWRCHWAVEQEANDKQHPPMLCTVCPRSFHYKCLSGTERSKIVSEKNWVCPECLIVVQAESSESRSPAMKRISLSSLSDLLKHALDRMMDLNGVEPFMQPVDRIAFPDYEKYVVHPMDMSIMKNNLINGLYGSTEAFLTDAQWILHNSIIFNTMQSKLTAAARALVRSCKAEIGEIEACPECYAAAHSRKPTWFTDVCSTPHMLLWAKLKGFPYWPAKCMSVSSASLVDVRFFGAHDRAWVPARDCFLFSEKDPNNFRTKRQDILDSMQEAEQHIRNISRKYGKFVYPPFKTQLDPSKLTEQLKIMIPTFEGEIKVPIKDKGTPKLAKNKSRSNSKCSKSSSNDGEISDGEDTKLSPCNTGDTSEVSVSDDFSIEKDATLPTASTDVADVPKEIETSRKRRRSEMEEAVITIMEGPKEKRKCVENDHTSQDIQTEPKINNTEPAGETHKKNGNTEKVTEITTISTLLPVDDKILLNNSSPLEIKRPPIKMILKTNKCFKTSSSKDKHNPTKTTPFKLRVLRIEKKKSTDKDKHDKVKHKRRNSKNTSLNSSFIQILRVEKNDVIKTSDVLDGSSENKDETKDNTVKVDNLAADNTKSKENGELKESNCEPEVEKVKHVKSKEAEATRENNSVKSKEPTKPKENTSAKLIGGEKLKYTNVKINKDSPKTRSNNTPKCKETVGSINSEKNQSSKRNSLASPKIKERVHFDEDNTSLAIIARESLNKGSLTGLPTISSVRSLSSPQTVESGTKTSHKQGDNNKDASIFTPTSTDTVRNMNEALTKLNKLRTDNNQSLVGKVGVCAFARMPSTPPVDKSSNKDNENVEVEIKTEPIDFDDADRQVEKLHLMKAFSLRPVSAAPPTANLREVRINKVIPGPVSRKTVTKAESKNKAKKTFPQQKKGEDGRSELNSKNSMVYIPIQPPVTQAPIRLARPVTINGNSSSAPATRTNLTFVTANSSLVKTAPSTQVVVPPSQVVLPSTNSPPAVPSTMTVVSVTSNAAQPHPAGPAPTTLHSVHTVPLITSVNGQWTFSLQPIMSVGGLDVLDEDSTSPMLNGGNAADRSTGPPAIMPAANGPNSAPFAAAPKPVATNTVTPTNTTSPKIAVPQPLLQSVSPFSVGNRIANEDGVTNVGEPPRLQHKPLLHPFDSSVHNNVPPPSTAGPITAKLNQNAIKLTDFFRTILEDSIERIDEPAAELTALKLQIEEMRWRHSQELNELKHNQELILSEMRATFEKDRVRAVNEARRAAQLDLEAAVKVTKSKQWCANCSQEAHFYCCWNTSYCDYGCQRAHWSQHYAICMQQRTQDSETETNSANSRRQSPSENLPKTIAAPTLSKAPISRPVSQEPSQKKSTPKSIIVSMVEDRSGNTTMKCVGTYKPATQPAAPTVPVIVNKPVNMINSDDVAAKKVVTSGGYLIVGAPNTSPLVTPPRRPQTVQYFS